MNEFRGNGWGHATASALYFARVHEHVGRLSHRSSEASRHAFGQGRAASTVQGWLLVGRTCHSNPGGRINSRQQNRMREEAVFHRPRTTIARERRALVYCVPND